MDQLITCLQYSLERMKVPNVCLVYVLVQLFTIFMIFPPHPPFIAIILCYQIFYYMFCYCKHKLHFGTKIKRIASCYIPQNNILLFTVLYNSLLGFWWLVLENKQNCRFVANNMKSNSRIHKLFKVSYNTAQSLLFPGILRGKSVILCHVLSLLQFDSIWTGNSTRYQFTVLPEIYKYCVCNALWFFSIVPFLVELHVLYHKNINNQKLQFYSAVSVVTKTWNLPVVVFFLFLTAFLLPMNIFSCTNNLDAGCQHMSSRDADGYISVEPWCNGH